MTIDRLILKLIRFRMFLGGDAKIVMCVGGKNQEYHIEKTSLINHENKQLMICVSVREESDYAKI